MNAINAASSGPVFTHLSVQATVASDTPMVKDISTQTATHIAARLPGAACAADLPLEAPGPEAQAPANAKAAAQKLVSLNATQVSVDIYAIQSLINKIAQESRNTARTQREHQTQVQVISLRSEAQEMRDSAGSTFKAAVIQGAMQIAGGAMQVGFSAAAAAKSIKGINQEADGRSMLNEAKTAPKADRAAMRTEGLATMKDGKVNGASASADHGYAQGMSGIAGGIGTIASAKYTREAAESDAKRKEQEVVTKVAEAGVQAANDAMQQAQEMIVAAKDMAKSLDQSNTETNRKINGNI